jgi:hypothetical protein
MALERNGDHLFVGVTEFDERGYGVRAYVLSSGRGVHDDVMRRRFEDLKVLTAGNVRVEDLT